MVTLLLSTAALVVLTALGAGTLLYLAASSKEVDACEDAEAERLRIQRPSYEPDVRDARGGPRG